MNLQHKHSVLTGHSNSNLSNSNKILGLIQKSINKLYDRLETNIGKMNLKKNKKILKNLMITNRYLFKTMQCLDETCGMHKMFLWLGTNRYMIKTKISIWSTHRELLHNISKQQKKLFNRKCQCLEIAVSSLIMRTWCRLWFICFCQKKNINLPKVNILEIWMLHIWQLWKVTPAYWVT